MKPELQKIFTKLSEEKLEKVELGLLQDILSDVSTNGKLESKARADIREAFKRLGSAFEAYEGIEKRAARMKQNTKKFQSEMQNLGIDKSSLDTTGKFALDGTYADMAENKAKNLKHLRDALMSLRQTGEI